MSDELFCEYIDTLEHSIILMPDEEILLRVENRQGLLNQTRMMFFSNQVKIYIEKSVFPRLPSILPLELK